MGTNQAFSFDPADAGVGFYRVGLLYLLGGAEQTKESKGAIQVQGIPEPIFVQPSEALVEVIAGDELTISFDVQDPEGEVQWRLFYLDADDALSDPPDILGVQLAVGSGNVGTTTWDTTDVAEGDHRLGLSATDSGFSIADTVDRGELDRIVTTPSEVTTTPTIRVRPAGTSRAPTLSFTAPGNAAVSLFADDPFTIRFSGTTFEDPADASIDLFYDVDTNVSNGVTPIASGLPVGSTSFAFPSDVPEGSYFVGGTIRDGVNAAKTVYATGQIHVVRTITLSVTRPNSPLPVRPDANVAIEWETNAPESAGTVDVFAQRIDASGLPFGSEVSIVAGGEITTNVASFTSSTPGLFIVTVRLKIRDGSTVEDDAPVNVRFSSAPGVLWVGSFADEDSGVDGAIFGGVNFEDNAGSSLSSAGDLNGDGLSEYIIASRYGKPFFLNPDGVGQGEAYLLYGATGAGLLKGEYNLNSVGTSGLRGITLTGIPTVGNTSETDGLSDVALIPDADRDELSEIVFGFPSVNSARRDVLEVAGQFLPGGVVILSSRNRVLADPVGSRPVINLDRVGRQFSNQTVDPVDRTATLSDTRQFQAGNPTGDPPTPDACIEGSDQEEDTIVGPSMGFTDRLAPPRWETLNPTFSIIPGNANPALNVCPTVFALVDCVNATSSDPFFNEDSGSGFYINTATALEPFGARILGTDAGDLFGTSVTFSRSSAAGTLDDLIFSAPGRSGPSSDSGVAYLGDDRDLWRGNASSVIPPTPHQYVMGVVSHCGDNRAAPLGALRVNGDANDQIQNIEGINDFNRDGRADFVVGAPLASGGKGRVYVAYRREPSIEGDFALNKLALAPDDPLRLDGMLIVTNTVDSFGASVAGGFDFNGDGISDIAIGSPNAGGGVGEVVIVFGGTGVVSPAGGMNVGTLLSSTRTAGGLPVAARITGITIDNEKGLFGFNIANVGDIDGDGRDDLAIAAPNASPRFDPNPNDATDALTSLGVDQNFDGVRDNVPGDDELRQAGLVYVIFGSNRLDQIKVCQTSKNLCNSAADCTTNESCVSTDITAGVSQLGRSTLRGFIVAGRRAGDRLGGGDAGDAAAGGRAEKQGRGRSLGLAGAGDVDGDGRDDLLVGSVVADPRRDPNTGIGVQNGGEVYLVYGSSLP